MADTIRVSPASLDLTELLEDIRSRPTFPRIRDSMRETGINAVPIIVSPADKGKRRVYEGNTRTVAALDLGLPELEAVEYEGQLTKAGLAIFSATCNGLRRSLQPEEWGAFGETIMEEQGCTQDEAARQLKITAGYLSRCLTAMLLPAKYADKAKLVNGKVRTILAAERDSAIQDALFTYATTSVNGKLPTADMVTLKRKALKTRPGRKPKPVKLTAGDVALTVPGDMPSPTLLTTDGGIVMLIPGDTDYEQAEKDLQDALKRIRKGKKIGEAEVQPVLLPQG